VNMADLLDIVPATSVEVVRIDGQRLVVRGLRAPAVAAIVARFPNIVGLLLGGGGINDVSSARFIEQFGGAIGPIIAAGCGHLGDERYEQHASEKLLLEDQLKLCKAIIQLTFPNGVGFFVEIMKGLSDEEAEAKAKPIIVRRSKKSPSQLPLSSEPDSHPAMS